MRRVKRLRPRHFVVLLVAFGLLLAGMRVPDISRPHRPKASPRAVVASHLKVAPEACHKQHKADFVALVPVPVQGIAPILVSACAQEPALSEIFTLCCTRSGRSPPSLC